MSSFLNGIMISSCVIISKRYHDISGSVIISKRYHDISGSVIISKRYHDISGGPLNGSNLQNTNFYTIYPAHITSLDVMTTGRPSALQE